MGSVTGRGASVPALALMAVAGRGEDQAKIAAIVAGAPIELAEVDGLVRPQLMDLQAREHQLPSQALDALVARTLIEKEAAARGMTAEALDQAEVAAKVKLTDEELKAMYAANKARLGNKSEADGLEQVRSALTQQRQAERRNAFARELRAKYDVKLLLEPYRVPVELAGAPVRGNPKAPVTIVEFSDFQCPFCVRARPTVARVREAYGDRVRFAFRHFPLDFHPQAQKAGEAAACAGEQDRFWQMHDRLWENPAVRSRKMSKSPLDTPRGKPTKLGVVVATPKFGPPSGKQQWMCEALVRPSKPENEPYTRIVSASVSTSTIASLDAGRDHRWNFLRARQMRHVADEGGICPGLQISAPAVISSVPAKP